MKTLLLVRHAKSSWESPGIPDFDRGLNERGKRDAPQMAKRLKKMGIKIDLLLSSPAKRAKKTAELFAAGMHRRSEEVHCEPELYLPHHGSFYSLISKLPDKVSCAAIFSHNPGITDFANSLTDVRVDNMPTCSVFAVNISADSWANAEAAAKTFLFFDYPKSATED